VPGPAARSQAQHLGPELLVRQVSKPGVSEPVPAIAHGVEPLDQLDVPPVHLEPPLLLAGVGVQPAVPAHPPLEPLQQRVGGARWSRAYPYGDQQGEKQGRPRHCWSLARGGRRSAMVHGGAMIVEADLYIYSRLQLEDRLGTV